MLITFIALLVGYSLFFTLHLNCQENEKERIEALLAEYESEINGWENSANLLIILVIAVGSLGVITGILQKSRKKWCKGATIAAGVVISLITIVNNTLFDVDYRTLLSRAEKGRRLIRDIRFELVKGYDESNKEERDEWLNKIHSILIEIGELPSMKVAAVNFQIRSASPGVLYAMDTNSQEPPWLNKLPADKDYLFFVGFAENESLKKAKELSYWNGIKEAAEFFEHRLSIVQTGESGSIDIKGLSRFLTGSAKVVDTYYQKNSGDEFYNYCTLIKINKNVTSTDLRFYAIKENISLPTSIKKSLDTVQQSSEIYCSKRLAIYRKLQNQAKEELTKENFEMFTKGRQLRQAGKAAEAINILKHVVEVNPEFYFGWHNLALAYHSTGQTQEAKSSYEKAAQLEPKQNVRDASIYNSFGYFLYQQKEYKAAIKQFNKALEIEPNHPIAKRNLQAAEQELKKP